MYRTFILGLALAIGTTPAFAASFSELDSNGNQELSRDEFYGGVADIGTYSDWDANSDGLLDENEFNEIGGDWDYDTWDADANAYVDPGEFYMPTECQESWSVDHAEDNSLMFTMALLGSYILATRLKLDPDHEAQHVPDELVPLICGKP